MKLEDLSKNDLIKIIAIMSSKNKKIKNIKLLNDITKQCQDKCSDIIGWEIKEEMKRFNSLTNEIFYQNNLK
jgi:hypothetical protein